MGVKRQTKLDISIQLHNCHDKHQKTKHPTRTITDLQQNNSVWHDISIFVTFALETQLHILRKNLQILYHVRSCYLVCLDVYSTTEPLHFHIRIVVLTGDVFGPYNIKVSVHVYVLGISILSVFYDFETILKVHV